MQIELLVSHSSESDLTVLNDVFEAVKLDISAVCIMPNRLKCIREQINRKNTSVKLNVLIDYPYGASSAKTKEYAAIEAIKGVADGIDLVINPVYIADGDKSKLKKDFFAVVDACYVNSVPIRLVLNYQDFDTDTLVGACKTLKNSGIDNIVLGTGAIVDTLLDTMIVAEQISKKSGLLVTINTHNINSQTIRFIKDSDIFGLQVNSLHILRNVQCLGV